MSNGGYNWLRFRWEVKACRFISSHRRQLKGHHFDMIRHCCYYICLCGDFTYGVAAPDFLVDFQAVVAGLCIIMCSRRITWLETKRHKYNRGRENHNSAVHVLRTTNRFRVFLPLPLSFAVHFRACRPRRQTCSRAEICRTRYSEVSFLLFFFFLPLSPELKLQSVDRTCLCLYII